MGDGCGEQRTYGLKRLTCGENFLCPACQYSEEMDYYEIQDTLSRDKGEDCAKKCEKISTLDENHFAQIICMEFQNGFWRGKKDYPYKDCQHDEKAFENGRRHAAEVTRYYKREGLSVLQQQLVEHLGLGESLGPKFAGKTG